jgi:hypothetical protein
MMVIDEERSGCDSNPSEYTFCTEASKHINGAPSYEAPRFFQKYAFQLKSKDSIF